MSISVRRRSCEPVWLLLASLPILLPACCGDSDDDGGGTGGFPDPDPDLASIVYLADQDTPGIDEVFLSRFTDEGPQTASKIGPVPAPVGGVIDFRLAKNGSRVVIRTAPDPTEGDAVPGAEIWVIDLTEEEPGEALRINDPLQAGESIAKFMLTSDDERVVFTRSGPAGSALFVADVTTDPPGVPVQLDNSLDIVVSGTPTGEVADFNLSPDGSRAGFLVDAGGDVALFVVGIDFVGQGSGPSPALTVAAGQTPDGNLLDFQFSPDGQQLAFRRQVGGIPQLYVSTLGADGVPGTPQLASTGATTGTGVFRYGFSPDGAWLSFLMDEGLASAPTQELYLFDLSDALVGPVRVSGDLVDGGTVFRFVWAPDSSSLAYPADQDIDDQVELYLVSVASGVLPPVKLNGLLPTDGDVDKEEDDEDVGGDVIKRIAFAPDSQSIAYRADQEIDDVFELFLVDLTTIDLTGAVPAQQTKLNGPLPADGIVEGPFAYSPTGTSILYRAEQDVAGELELFLVDLTGPTPAAPLQISPELVPGGRVSSQLRFSPSGRFVLFLAAADVPDQNELWLVQLGNQVPLQPSDPIKVSGPLQAGANVAAQFAMAP